MSKRKASQAKTDIRKTPVAATEAASQRRQFSLKDIAERVGVSINTVSLALRNSPLVTKETADRILEVAKELRYRPNNLIRAIQTGHSGLVGVVMKPNNEWTTQMLLGIHEGLQEKGLLPLMDWLPSHFDRPAKPGERTELEVIHNLIDHRVDGMIVYPSNDQVADVYFNEVWERGIPLVTIDRLATQTHADFVGTDELVGGRTAAEHLLALGHRQIAHIAGYQGYGTYAKRRKVFEKIIRESGASCKIVEVGPYESSDRAVQELFKGGRYPTAIFLADDSFAPAVYQVATEKGLNIPDDLSVIGYGGLSWSRLVNPPLTTIRQDPWKMGVEAARIIIERLDNPNNHSQDIVSRQVRLIPKLEICSSTAACKKPKK
ncbi:MAG: LacI family DNA-binding transcriptional regulator [Kiritimatiellaceae bacterium]|nr:LacI family DNA-binding transcriptional regulator [Kiritimatiellaceae bacterium]